MARAFPLTGLLRLRRLQQEAAAGKLASANARAQETAARQVRARTELGEIPAEVTGTAVLHALAAARASSRSMLADLQALGARHQSDVESAQAAFRTARAESVGLEKLEEKHGAAVAAEQLHAEQTVLDEIAATGWHRKREQVPQ